MAYIEAGIGGVRVFQIAGQARAVGGVQHGAQYRLAKAFATRSLPCADCEEVEVAFGRMIFLHDLAGLQRPFHGAF